MTSLVNPSSHEHVMLLYDNDDERNEAAANYINEGLKSGQLAIYASVNASDESHMRKVLSRVINHKENTNRGNLFVLSLKSFYHRALNGDLEPFRDLKCLLEEIIQERNAVGKNGEVIVVADCADNLSRNEKFDECVFVERWWHDTHLEWKKNDVKITIICPHPGSVLRKNMFANNKQLISRKHSLTTVALSK